MKRFSDLVISQSCIYRITQNRASNYLTHARWRVPSIHCVGHRRGQYSTSASSTSRSPGAVGAPLWILKRRIIGSGAPFHSRDHPDMYLDTYLATLFGAMAARWPFQADLIFVKNAPGAYWRTIGTQSPRVSSSLFFHRLIYSVKLSRSSAYVIPPCIITGRKEREWLGHCAVRQHGFSFCSISFCCYINC